MRLEKSSHPSPMYTRLFGMSSDEISDLNIPDGGSHEEWEAAFIK